MTQRVLITGAGRDTGRLLARSFVAQGADVIVTARSLAAAEETVALIQADGGKASAMALDLSSPESVLRKSSRAGHRQRDLSRR